MALKPCKECSKAISNDAKTCPNCRKKAPHGNKLSTLRIILGTLLLGPILMPFMMTSLSVSQEGKVPDFGFISSRDAKDLCQRHVISMAKYPSSVETVFMGREAYQKPDGNVIATIEFSAQNSLGGRIPHRGICTINKNGQVNVQITRR